MSNFTDILSKYSSVDTSYGTDKNTSHSYGDVYNILFHPFKNTKGNILEIGFDSGFSLQAYHEYFSEANIYGIDIRDNCRAPVKNNPQIHLYFGDATRKETVSHFNTSYDIIVEDASHLPEHNIQHFIDYSPFVNTGGLYIIEDVHEDFYTSVFNTIVPTAKERGFSADIIDLRHLKNRFDDILIVLKKE
jgi:hypothetical protein